MTAWMVEIQFSNSVRAVIASEAKQSIATSKEKMDCFVASLLAMTSLEDARSHSRDAMRPGYPINVSLVK
jgi:hypothetical protein